MGKRRSYAVLLLLLASLYVGSYLVLVRAGKSYQKDSGWLASYRVGGAASQWFYWPVHRIDRRLRPEYWEKIGRWPAED
jgi:hypothetical protein